MLRYQVSRCNEIGFKLLLFLVLTLVTWQALTPQPLDPVQTINDKLGHMLVFLLLAAVTDHAFAVSSFNLKKVAFLMSYGIGLEIVQLYVPGRQFSYLDMLADASGLLIYWLLVTYVMKREPTPVDNKNKF